MFGPILKASMVGFTLLSRSYYYLRRRSPGPPFPPDHRQAGERGATKLKRHQLIKQHQQQNSNEQAHHI
jgi:hypothetical protein